MHPCLARQGCTWTVFGIRAYHVDEVLEGITKTVREHPNYKAERDAKSETEFRYVFGHRDDVNREVTVAILVFDVPA